MHGWNTSAVMLDDLIAFAWSAPMRELAAKVGMSDVGMKKWFGAHGVVSPPQGYWNKLRAGKSVPRRPFAPPRRPGSSGRVQVEARIAALLPVAPPMMSDGPFASVLVPEDLDALYQLELKAIGVARVPRSLDAPHTALLPLLKNEERRRQKNLERSYNWDSPKFAGPLNQRRLKFFNGLLQALVKRGHGGGVDDRSEQIYASAHVGEVGIGLNLEIIGRHATARQNGYIVPAPDLPANTPLKLSIDPDFSGKPSHSWSDGEDKIESQLAEIAATIIMAGEGKFRRRLREAEERVERDRLEAIRRREEHLAALNKQRVADLRESGALLREAMALRALVSEVREALDQGQTVAAADLDAWASWAQGEADKLDPILSGHIERHLYPPTLD